jgi:heme/copper-type cytochrome/quinol oxidase subunit 3
MTHPAEEHVSESIHLPKPTFWPLLLGLGFGLFVLGLLLYVNRDQALAIPPVAGQVMLIAGPVVLLAAIGGWVWSNLREKIHVPGLEGVDTTKFAMWCFLGTEIIIFGGFIARVITVWAKDPQAHKILTEPFTSLALVSLNTFLLLVSSLCVVLGLSSVQRGNRRGLALWLLATALLGATFVGIQGYEYTKLYGEGVRFAGSDAAYRQFGPAFYFLTGNHGLHVIVGVIWCLIVMFRALAGGFDERHYSGMEVFGLYWHFVDVVWIMIFTLVYLLPA